MTTKILILLIFICLSSCDYEHETSAECYQIREYNYNGHSYIDFSLNQMRNGIVHNPDCKKCLDRGTKWKLN